MGLFQQIMRRWNSAPDLSEIADQIADRSFDAVWHRVSRQILTLAPAQARGYIRARGVAVLHQQVALSLSQHRIDAESQPQLYALSVESLIRRVQTRARAITMREPLRRSA